MGAALEQAHRNMELHLYVCSLAISHVQRGARVILFLAKIMLYVVAGQIKMAPSAKSNVPLLRQPKCLHALYSFEQG